MLWREMSDDVLKEFCLCKYKNAPFCHIYYSNFFFCDQIKHLSFVKNDLYFKFFFIISAIKNPNKMNSNRKFNNIWNLFKIIQKLDQHPVRLFDVYIFVVSVISVDSVDLELVIVDSVVMILDSLPLQYAP